MASGLPDYQSEYKLTTGGILQNSGAQVIIGAATNVLLTILTKGTIIGGKIYCDFGVVSHKADRFGVIIDGSNMNVPTFELINKWGLDRMYTSFLYELLYDDVAFEYCLGFPNGVTFENSIVLNHTSGIGNCTVAWQLLFSLYQ